MKAKIPMIARYLLGVIFVFFGFNGFFNFMQPPPVPAEAGAFLGALAGAGYMFPLVKAIEVIVGVLLLTNKFVPLALLLLAPITVNIVAFHLFLAPAGLAVPILVLALHLYLAKAHWSAYSHLIKA